MKIQEQDVFHGPGLVQIVEHASFKALNRGSDKYGHYLINTDRHVFAKYSSRKRGPWQFTFQLSDLENLQEGDGSVFVMLSCGHQTVCALSKAELEEIIDLDSSSQQTVVVEVPPGGSCHVRGNLGKLGRAVPHNAFPKKVFE
jgi:hypothetical protein